MGANARLRRDAAQTGGQHVPIAKVWTGFRGGLVPGIADQEVLVVDVDGVGGEDRAEGVQQPGLPIDEGAVAVEREGLEAPVVQRHEWSPVGLVGCV